MSKLIMNPKRVADTALRALGWVIDIAVLCYCVWMYPIWTLGIAIGVIVIAWMYSVWRWSYNSGNG